MEEELSETMWSSASGGHKNAEVGVHAGKYKHLTITVFGQRRRQFEEDRKRWCWKLEEEKQQFDTYLATNEREERAVAERASDMLLSLKRARKSATIRMLENVFLQASQTLLRGKLRSLKSANLKRLEVDDSTRVTLLA